jgi:magnesium transporter
MKKPKKPWMVDDDLYSVRTLVWMRAPSLCIGLLLGLALSFATSRFEEVLTKNVSVAFFIPFIVYMADAVGTQTQAIYTRDLSNGGARFSTYLFKESALGVMMGIFFGCISFLIVSIWFDSMSLAATVGLSAFCAIAISPVVAIIVTELLQLDHQDPAIGAGPIATVIQDAVSIVVYGAIATAIIL